ncbi:MAG: PEGA domain-containing protein [Planctomycetota bacterium]|nr:PEGA domain-containing protein [Planctomycetota bacterium]
MAADGTSSPVVYSGPAPMRAEIAAWALAFLLAVVAGCLAGFFLRCGAPSGGGGPAGSAMLGADDYAPAGGGTRVEVASAPPGASVYVDGEIKGRAPISIAGLRSGRSVFRLEKDGYAPLVRAVLLPTHGPLAFGLTPLPSGAIRISAKTPGAEVLIDGEPAGCVPLTVSGLRTGMHEVVIRKTNFDAAAMSVFVKAGETVNIEGVELRDQVLAMLESMIRAEPWRIGHLLDLGHYHFLCGRIDDSVACYVKANNMAAEPIRFPDGIEMSEEDKAIEVRLRETDRKKLRAEINKHMNSSQWGRNAVLFREKIASAMPSLPPGPR